MSTKVNLPLMGIDVIMLDRAERAAHAPPQPHVMAAPAAGFVVPVVTLPIDNSGNNNISCGMYGNSQRGNCILAADMHEDNVWTRRQGQAIQSQYDESCIVNWWDHIPSGWAWGSNGLTPPTYGVLPCGSGALGAYPQATIWGTIGVDFRFDTPMTRYFLHNFYCLHVWIDLPQAFMNGFTGGSVWPKDIGAGNYAHAWSLDDVRADGLYRFRTWGTWGWGSAAFMTGAFGACWGHFSPRQFNPRDGMDSRGRHITDQAAVWAGIGGPPIPANLLSLFPAKGTVVTVLPVFVDNSHPGYSETGTAWFTWPTATAGQPTGYGGTIRATRTSGTGQNTATWQIAGINPGMVVPVQVSWAADPNNRASNASYQVWDGSTLRGTITVDQRQQPIGNIYGTTRFKLLGSFLCSSRTLKVTLSDNANGVVVADCVRFG